MLRTVVLRKGIDASACGSLARNGTLKLSVTQRNLVGIADGEKHLLERNWRGKIGDEQLSKMQQDIDKLQAANGTLSSFRKSAPWAAR